MRGVTLRLQQFAHTLRRIPQDLQLKLDPEKLSQLTSYPMSNARRDERLRVQFKTAQYQAFNLVSRSSWARLAAVFADGEYGQA